MERNIRMQIEDATAVICNAYGPLMRAKEHEDQVLQKRKARKKLRIFACFMFGYFMLCFFKIFISLRSTSELAALGLSIGMYYFLEKRHKGADKAIEAEKEDAMKYCNRTLAEHASVIQVLPQKYCYPHAAICISAYLRDLRADTLKEAINLYEQEMAQLELRRSLDHSMQQIRKEHRYQTAILSMIQWNLIFSNRY